MGSDNGRGLTVGVGRWAWWRRAKGENWDNCNRITIKNRKRKNSSKTSKTKIEMGKSFKYTF